MFLFGPRGTGKSTWIRDRFPGVMTYDLLSTNEFMRLSREPGLLFREAETLSPRSWVVIDEVQKVPELLNEVHRLIESRHLKFILSGSSARKLRRGGTNLLAGRAAVHDMFPLTSREMSFDFSVEEALVRGTMPLSVTGEDPLSYLSAYAATYLQEEIRAEALTRNIGGFSRFLEVAARQNGQITNVSAIARDAGVSRQTVQTYFDILVDTLIGYWVNPWKLKTSTKQVSHPKFYLYDAGVARVLSGRLPYPPTLEERGPLLETFLFNEIRAFISYGNLHYPFFFWRSYGGVEVDFLCETPRGFVAIELKSTRNWQKRHNRGLHRAREELGRESVTCYGVYEGEREALWDDVRVLPVLTFLRRLWDGEIL